MRRPARYQVPLALVPVVCSLAANYTLDGQHCGVWRAAMQASVIQHGLEPVSDDVAGALLYRLEKAGLLRICVHDGVTGEPDRRGAPWAYRWAEATVEQR